MLIIFEALRKGKIKLLYLFHLLILQNTVLKCYQQYCLTFSTHMKQENI